MGNGKKDPRPALAILDALGQRALVRRLGNSEYRTRCLCSEKHKHGDAHPSMGFNPEKGAICRVCGFKGGLPTLAQELGIDHSNGQRVCRFRTAQEAMQALKDEKKLRAETIAHFGIEADMKRMAWVYPLPSGHRRWKAFDGNSTPRKYWHERGTPNQLHGLDDIPRGAEEILTANGESAIWSSHQAQVSAVCGIYGEGHLPQGTLSALLAKGVKTITLVPDLDKPGRNAILSDFNGFMQDPALRLVDPSDGVEFFVLQLPHELGEGADLADLYVWCGGSDEQFRTAIAKAIAIWKRHGVPVIHLAPGENCFDLQRLLLTQSKVEPWHLEAVARWLEQRLSTPNGAEQKERGL